MIKLTATLEGCRVSFNGQDVSLLLTDMSVWDCPGLFDVIVDHRT